MILKFISNNHLTPGLSDPEIGDMFQINSNINSSRNGESNKSNNQGKSGSPVNNQTSNIFFNYAKLGTLKNGKHGQSEYFNDENS